MRALLIIVVLIVGIFVAANWDRSAPPANHSIPSTYVAPPESHEVVSERARRDAARTAVEIATMSWSKEYGVMTARFTFNNPTDYDVKDLDVRCQHSGPSGTVMDANSRTIYEIVPARGRKTIAEVNMGFINSQATRTSCSVRNAVVGAHRPAPPKPAPKPAGKPQDIVPR